MAEKKTSRRSKPATKAVARQSGKSDKPIIAWQAQEFEQYDRNKGWYVLVGVVGVLLIAGSLFLQQWLVAVVFALATFVVLQHAGDKPRTFSYSISRLGVTTSRKFVPFSELKTFWVIYNPPVRNLTFQGTNRFKPLIKMNLGEVDPEAIRQALKPYLPETPKQSEDIVDKFSRFIRL